MKKDFLFKTLLTCGFAVAITACSDDPDPVPGNVTHGNYVVGVSTDAKSYLLATDNLASGKISVISNGIEASESTIYPYNNGEKGFIFLYRKGDPATVQSCSFLSGGKLSVNSPKTMPTREEFIGYYKSYVIAMTSINLSDGKFGEAFNFINGSTESIETAYLSTENILHKGEYANMGGLETVGDNIITALEPFKIPASGTTSEPTAYPDEMSVAILKKEGQEMKISKVITDNRASFGVGRRRSGRLSCLGMGGDGNIYVFSPANLRNAGTSDKPDPVQVTKFPSSVLKIDKNSLDFDKNYYYNIEEKSGGLKLQNAFALYGDYFLLNMFATEKSWNMQLANKFAIFNVKNGEFHWVEGLPAPENIGGYSPKPYVEGEKVYLPLTASAQSFVYVIDAKTAKAEKGVEIEGDIIIGGITKLAIPNSPQ
jgi:hypothetical protein